MRGKGHAVTTRLIPFPRGGSIPKVPRLYRRLVEKYSRLTPHQILVTYMRVEMGLSCAEIAVTIGRSHSTVKMHDARARERIGVSSVAELFRTVKQALRDLGGPPPS